MLAVCLCSERLVESLRLPQVPILHAQVFLFFRVLLLRMSPQHLTSLWPTMITELVITVSFLLLPFLQSPTLRLTVTLYICFPAGPGVSPDGAGANSRWRHIKVHYPFITELDCSSRYTYVVIDPLLSISRTSGPSVAGLETTYSGGNGFSTSYNSQRWLNLYLSACKLLDLALALPPESLPQFQMSV